MGKKKRMENNRDMADEKGCWWKGKFIPVGWGLYCKSSDNPSFIRGALPNISRAIKAEMHDAAVCVEYETDEDTT